MSQYKLILNPFTGKLQYVPTNAAVLFKDGVPSVVDLPLSGNIENDARIVQDDGHLYIWNGSTWIDEGDFANVSWTAIINKPTSSVSEIDTTVTQAIKSVEAGDWKKITNLEYNIVTSEIRVVYNI